MPQVAGGPRYVPPATTGGGGGGGVDSVNGDGGPDVILDSDDISDTGKSHKFVTTAEKTKLANLSGTNTGDQDLTPYALDANAIAYAIALG